MINENNVIDKTEMIRKIKHSHLLRDEVNKMITLKKQYTNVLSSQEFKTDAKNECTFLFQYYTDIFHKLIKDEINVIMLFDFLDILEKIEKGTINQHEASFKVGTILKNMYIDSAVKHAENMDKERETDLSSDKPKQQSKDISWKHFKKMKYINK
jgi:hypothetical protein